MAWGRPYRYAVESTPRRDGQLSIVRVERSWKGPDRIVLSDGQEVISRWERLTTQCELHCQWQTAIRPRLWALKDATELIALCETCASASPLPPQVF
jgi:hypothetical protein